ncbi:MAG: Fur family transcriptional regulator [Verrucomicrobiota bacterium]
MSQRNTRQKKAIQQVIAQAEHPLTAHEIGARANASVPGIGIATIYRALKRLQQEQAVTVVELSGKSPRYESTQKGHHHHFVCSGCGQVYDLQGCSGNVEALAPKGFKVEKHEITLFGLCQECA